MKKVNGWRKAGFILVIAGSILGSFFATQPIGALLITVGQAITQVDSDGEVTVGDIRQVEELILENEDGIDSESK